MGWLYLNPTGFASAKAYLDDQFSYENKLEDGTTQGLRVLASSCLRNQVWYGAVEPVANGVPGPVFAAVCLVRWNPRAKDGLILGYKDMSETSGPCEAECPERILDMLGPTDNEYALDWRRRCIASLKLRTRKIENGMRIRLAQPLSFTDGHKGEEFIVEKRGRKTSFIDPATRGRYRISRFGQRAWSVVSETKIHRTVFA